MEYVCKVVVIGEAGVGKTALLRRYLDEEFTDTYLSTVGVDFRVKTLYLPEEQKQLKFQIWDCAGQERFRSITNSYYRGAQAILLVYDITNEKSFQQLELWLEEIRRYLSTLPPIFIVGNKIDCERKRVVSHAEVIRLRQRFWVSEVSALTGEGVNLLFEGIAKRIIAEYGDRLIRIEGSRVRLLPPVREERSKCPCI